MGNNGSHNVSCCKYQEEDDFSEESYIRKELLVNLTEEYGSLIEDSYPKKDAAGRLRRISSLLIQNPKMEDLVQPDIAFTFPETLMFRDALSEITISFHDWFESTIWRCYQAHFDDHNLPEDIRGIKKMQDEIATVLAIDGDENREKELRAWVNPKSPKAASTKDNIDRRMNCEMFLSQAIQRFSEYENLLKIFNPEHFPAYVDSSRIEGDVISGKQIAACVMMLRDDENLGFQSFALALPVHLRGLVMCDSVNIALVNDEVDELWFLQREDGQDEIVKISENELFRQVYF